MSHADVATPIITATVSATPPATAAGRDDRAAIDKAICLLDSFGADCANGVGVSELARRAELSKSTAFRVLSMLERNGVVERCGTDYRIGARLHELSRTVYAPGQEELRDMLIPFVSDLYAATGETVHLAALYGTDVIYLAKLYGHQHLPSPARIGRRIPAHCTAVGKALLAHDPVATERLFAAPIPRFTENTVTEPGRLSAQFDQIRTRGVAVEDGEVQRGLCCIAVPVFGPNGRALAAMSVSGPQRKLNPAKCEPILRRIAHAASQAAARTLASRVG